MGDPHRRVGGVHALAARAGRPVDVDLQVVRVELDLHLLGLGQHGDRGRRGVDAALALGDRARAALGAGPPSCFMRGHTPSPLSMKVTSLNPPMSEASEPITSAFQPMRPA